MNTIHRILHYDVPNSNGIIYPKPVIEEMVAKWNNDKEDNKIIATFLSTDTTPDPNSMVGIINDMIVDDEGVIIIHTMIESEAAYKVTQLLEDGKCKLSPYMTGTIVDNKVTDCSIRYISFSALNNE